MADVNDLLIRIDATTEQLRRELKRADTSLQNNERKINKTTRRIDQSFTKLQRGAARLALTFGLAFGAAGLGRHIANQIRSADELLKMTDRIGGSVEALSELQFVAERNGVAFNTFTMGLQRMTRRISEASDGSGEAQAALRELRLSAEVLEKLPLDRQFEVIADRLSSVEGEADRTRLAMRLFDSEGVALLQTMDEGAEGIQRLRTEAKSLGRVFTTEMAEDSERARDAMTNLRASIDGLSMNALPSLAKAIETVATGYNRLLFGADPFPFEKQITALEFQVEKIQGILDLRGADDANFIARMFGAESNEELRAQLEEVSATLAEARRKQRVALGLEEDSSGDDLNVNLPADAEARLVEVTVPVRYKLRPNRAQEFLRESQAGIDAMLALGDEVSVPVEYQLKRPNLPGGMFGDMQQDLLDMRVSAENEFEMLGDTLGRTMVDSAADWMMGIETSFDDLLRRMIARAASTKMFEFLGQVSGPVGSFFSFLGFKTGGSFEVGGTGGPDSKLVAFRASPGEMVNVSNRGQQAAGAGGGSNTVINIQAGLPSQIVAEVENVAARVAASTAIKALQRGR